LELNGFNRGGWYVTACDSKRVKLREKEDEGKQSDQIPFARKAFHLISAVSKDCHKNSFAGHSDLEFYEEHPFHSHLALAR
jgi:hypothetical protein